MADPKGCRDCGQLVRWTAYEVNPKGEYLRGPEGKAVVHHCERQAAAFRLGENSSTPVEGNREPTIPFGKHKGTTVAALAATAEGIDYLKWLGEHAEKQWLKDAVAAALAGEYGSNLRPVERKASAAVVGQATYVDCGDSWDG